MKIGCASQVYFGQGSMEEVISKVAEMGFDGIELEFGTNRLTAFEGTKRAKKLKELCDSKGLTISNLQPHTFFITLTAGPWQIPMQEQKELLFFKTCCEFASAMNVPYVRVQIISHTYGPLPQIVVQKAPDSPVTLVTPSLMAQFTQGLNTLVKAVKIAEDIGVTLGLDNHYFLTVMDHVKIVKQINSPNLKLFQDVANATLHGEDIVANVKACGKLLVHSHVKDRAVFGNKVSGEFTDESVVPIGMGIVPWKDYLTALRDVGFKGFLSIEGNAVGYSTDETVRIGLKYLRDLSKELGA